MIIAVEIAVGAVGVIWGTRRLSQVMSWSDYIGVLGIILGTVLITGGFFQLLHV